MGAVKLLVVGESNSGKTTVTSKLEKALVVSIDGKTYPYKVPHYRPATYSGIENFKNEMISKLKSYKEKYGERPQTIVFDTVTKLYEEMYKYAQKNFKGFDVHNAIANDTLSFNDLIEDFLIANGVNVVIIAHVVWEKDTNSWVVPATGAFAKSGSWLSLVDESSFIYKQGNSRMISHSEMKYPCRTTCDMPVKEKIDEYDINVHMKKLMDKQSENAEYTL